MTPRKPAARIKGVTPMFEGFLTINRYRLEVDRHQGGVYEVDRLVMERGHAVGVLGYDPVRDEIVLANELRPGMLAAGDGAFADNLIAGGIGADESVIDAAVREMKEETGLELRDPVVVHPGAFVSSGGTSEKIAIVVGFVDTSQAGGVHGHPDEGEDILTVVLSADEFISRVRRAEIKDLKTLVAGYWLAENRDTLRCK
jgi:ADP-ribose pyrophosphatase